MISEGSSTLNRSTLNIIYPVPSSTCTAFSDRRLVFRKVVRLFNISESTENINDAHLNFCLTYTFKRPTNDAFYFQIFDVYKLKNYSVIIVFYS